ncbi:MAG: YraN family protein [Elusimicrobia bacterium]|nr:YraN family protein [Elusimicrobiota bacterium]
MTFERQARGRWGETLAGEWLRARGVRVLAKNYRTPLGEIDIIAQEEHTIVFMEVKTWLTDRFGAGETAVTPGKQRRLVKAALIFLKQRHLTHRPIRFDVFATGPQGSVWLPHAFTPDDHYTV